MKTRLLSLLLLLLMAAPAHAQTAVNGQLLTPGQVAALSQIIGPVQPGSFWYDPYCGAYGYVGGPIAGLLQAGLPLGRCPRNASNGTSSVLINGRELQAQEVAALQQLVGTYIPPGAYFLDAQGNAGPVGGAPTVNLLQLARSRGGGGARTTQGSFATVMSDGEGFTGVYIPGDHGGTGSTWSR